MFERHKAPDEFNSILPNTEIYFFLALDMTDQTPVT
jgi:hypothetical protein